WMRWCLPPASARTLRRYAPALPNAAPGWGWRWIARAMPPAVRVSAVTTARWRFSACPPTKPPAWPPPWPPYWPPEPAYTHGRFRRRRHRHDTGNLGTAQLCDDRGRPAAGHFGVYLRAAQGTRQRGRGGLPAAVGQLPGFPENHPGSPRPAIVLDRCH